jgi:hypothetical protein
LSFHYNNGYQTFVENIEVGNNDTASKLTPVLLSLFFSNLSQAELIQSETTNSYITLTQGGTERELDRCDKPLEIALDCSVKGLHSPTFTLKTSLSLLPNTPQNLKKKLSISSLTASSYSSLGQCSSEGSESPQIIEGGARTIGADDESMYSFASGVSYASYTHPPSRSIANNSKSHLKPHSTSKLQHKMLEHTNSKLSEISLDSPTRLTPDISSSKSRSKSKVGNFMEGVARSLKKPKRKSRPSSIIYPEDDRTVTLRDSKKSLNSPVLIDKRLSMPIVFHIHYSNAKNSQLYKSVLVSENSTTCEVIKQSLERYSMKHADPADFTLVEVIGQWEPVALQDAEISLDTIPNIITPMSPGDPLLERSTSVTPAFEEFVVYYTRELNGNEQPYNVQFFNQPPDGYTRRFELRSKPKEEEKLTPTTPIFGNTSHNSRGAHLKASSVEDITSFEALTGIPFDKINKDDQQPLSKSTPVSSFLDCSSPDGELDTPGNTNDSSIVDTTHPYLLNLQLTYNTRESLVYTLSNTDTVITSTKIISDLYSDHHVIQLECEPDENNSILFTIHKDEGMLCIIDPMSTEITINGTVIDKPTELYHGDLVKVETKYLFMFQNVHSSDVQAEWPYRWYPTKTKGDSTPIYKPIGEIRNTSSSNKQFSAEVVMIDSGSNPSSPVKPARTLLPTLKEVEDDADGGGEDTTHIRPGNVSLQIRGRSHSDSKANRKHKKILSSPMENRSTSSFLKKLNKFETNCKIEFPYSHAKEEALLNILINDLQPLSVNFHLAPVYVIAMCLEYNLNNHGIERGSRFICKTVTSIQHVIWKLSSEVSLWQPDFNLQNNKPSLKEIHSLLYSLLFWFSNCLELYNHLLTQQESLNLIMCVPGEEQEKESALTLLENMNQQLFQQAFYLISKSLYSSLSMMFEEVLIDSDRNQSVCQSIECMKELLDMMLELHVHTEMIANLFANIFFFINGAMLNIFIDQGPDIGLFEYVIGTKLRICFDMFEDWAGKVGFRDIAFQFFGPFLSILDLISISPQELITLSWENLREEFPCLQPAQLHYILKYYTLPLEISNYQPQWAPSIEDSSKAIDEEMLHESFDAHPQFFLPLDGYTMDLTKRQQDGHLLDGFVSWLRKKIQESDGSNWNKNKQIAMINDSNSFPISPLRKPTLNVSEMILESPKFSRKVDKNLANSEPHYSHKAMRRVKDNKTEQRGRVQSIVEPKLLLAAPEKLTISVMESTAETSPSQWLDDATSQYPDGYRTLSLQRGNRGFGFTLDKKEDSNGIFIKSSSFEEICDLHKGDQVLAIDDMMVDDTDYLSIQKYIKDAEEELTIVLAPRASQDY